MAVQKQDSSKPTKDESLSKPAVPEARRDRTSVDSTLYFVESDSNELPLRYFDKLDIK